MSEKIALGTYPYTFARISVMRAALLQREDYHRLLKMGTHEIISFLQESGYKREISELGVAYSGVDLMERALNRNLENTFDKLRRISKNTLLMLVNTYLMRYDVDDLKTVLRAKYTKLSPEKTATLVTAAGSFSMEQLAVLAAKETVRDILQEARKLGFPDMQKEYEEFEKTNMLRGIENGLNQAYYKKVFDFASAIPKGGKLFREFLEKELEVKNLVSVFRLKRAGADTAVIEESMLPVGRRFRKVLLRLAAAGLEEAAEVLKDTAYSDIVREGVEDFRKTGSLIRVERLLQAHLLRGMARLQHRNPLSVDFILGYMFAKETEVKNIQTILRGRQLRVDDAIIEMQVVVPGG